jgi:CRP/FNR family transcriptional regulator, nitrogen fixation regulation protein
MSRYDIADYLAISVETVSRSLTDLKHRGSIRLTNTRQVRIVDREALTEAAMSAGIGIAG